jgi:pimeloyl-ACP methyl ester carboxylesterase
VRLPALLLVLSALVAPGCYFTRSPSRPLPALEALRRHPDRQDCLVVMLPGFLDGPDTYLDHGFPRRLVESGAPCDAVMVDLHYRYYSEIGIADIVYEDILVPATTRGYDEIWLVGISMGGLGTLLTTQRYHRLIDGVILLAPFVGEEGTLREIEAAGGAELWRPPSSLSDEPWSQSNYTAHLWSYLRGYRTDPDGMPPLYIGWGESDRLGPADRLLGALLDEDHVFVIPGRHNWATWSPLFEQILTVALPGGGGREEG